jgi:hypothetical protein
MVICGVKSEANFLWATARKKQQQQTRHQKPISLGFPPHIKPKLTSSLRNTEKNTSGVRPDFNAAIPNCLPLVRGDSSATNDE